MLNSLNNIWCDAFEIIRPGSVVSIRFHHYSNDSYEERYYIALGPSKIDDNCWWILGQQGVQIDSKRNMRFIK